MTAAEFIYTVVLRPKPLKKLANAFLRSILPKKLVRHGATIALNPNDPVVSGALTLGVYEKSETNFFCKVCRPGMTFVDVGANVGFYTALAISRVGSRGKIVALEPDPESFRYLKSTVEANGGANVTCIQKAAADCTGTLTLHISKDNRGDNRLYKNELSDSSIGVEVATLDGILESCGVQTVDLLKIDVQGYEGQVLRGMKGTLSRSPRIIILTEFWPYGLTSAGSQPIKILEDLETAGITLFELHPNGKLDRIEDKSVFISRYAGRKYASVVGLGSANPHHSDWGRG